MTEVQSFLKPDPIECGCGCGREGQPKVKPWSNGQVCVKNCDHSKCPRCRGRNNKRSGGKNQRAAARGLGIQRSSISTGHEENAGGAIRFEHKSGAQAKPVWTRFMLSEQQSEAARPIGDPRPFIATFSVLGDSETLGVFRLSNATEVAHAILDNLEGGD